MCEIYFSLSVLGTERANILNSYFGNFRWKKTIFCLYLRGYFKTTKRRQKHLTGKVSLVG